MTRVGKAEFLFESLELQSTTPLHRQVYVQIRRAIMEGRLRPGACVPSTRSLAALFQVSRNTVLEAFYELSADGYLEGRAGSGTYVASSIPDQHDLITRESEAQINTQHVNRALSIRGEEIVSISRRHDGMGWRNHRAFYPGLPAYDMFPWEAWRRIASRQLRLAPQDKVLGYGNPAGLEALRDVIAENLARTRAVNCSPRQVLIVTGSQHALSMAATVLLDVDDSVWLEDPGFPGASAAFRAAGAKVLPVPVDEEGLCVAQGIRNYPNARMAYVSPSHQYPLGHVMSLRRRLELLAWAESAAAWIVEDDYDSEFRYGGRPLAALRGLDENDRVIYVGTFSKVLFPSLRLGYMVVPERLIDGFTAAQSLSVRHPPTLDQTILAEFIGEGHYERHIRRMRSVYKERQEILLAALSDMGEALTISADQAGMHVVAWLPQGVNDKQVAIACAQVGISTPPLSDYSIASIERGALLLGYTGYEPGILRSRAVDLVQVVARSTLHRQS